MQAYLLAALKGEPMARAPDGYIVSYFDKFADEFDQKLVDVLGYTVPGKLAAMVAHPRGTRGHPAHERSRSRLRHGPGRRAVRGPDRRSDRRRSLTPHAGQGAGARLLRVTLVEAEVMAFLTGTNAERYDLVVAADMLIYFGDLSPIFEGVARVLAPRWHCSPCPSRRW